MKRVAVIFVLFFVSGTLAISGVSPGSYEVGFRSFLEEEFIFTFISDDDVVSRIYAEGELAKYVVLDKREIVGTERVRVILKLPEKLEAYGENRIRIGAKQVSSVSGNVGVVSDAGGIIKVFVPYPGKNARVELSVLNANVGEDIKVNLKIFNLGNESILAVPVVQVFKEEIVVGDLDFESVSIETLAFFETTKFLKSDGFSYGDYGVAALVDYGVASFARDEAFFKLGDFLVEITDHSKKINKSELEKFDIETTSFWNNEIRDLRAEVYFNNETFFSHSFNLKPWEGKNISVFVDSSKIRGKNAEGVIKIFYGDRTTSKNFSVEVNSKKDVYVFLVLIVVLILVLIYWQVNK